MMFDMRILNLDTCSYLHMMPKKDLENLEKDKKDRYLQACLGRRCMFNLIVYYTDGNSRAEALAAQRRLTTLPSFKMKREYSKLCVFVQARISLEIEQSNSLLLCGPWYTEAYIHYQLELAGGSVMALILPWRRQRAGQREQHTK